MSLCYHVKRDGNAVAEEVSERYASRHDVSLFFLLVPDVFLHCRNHGVVVSLYAGPWMQTLLCFLEPNMRSEVPML